VLWFVIGSLSPLLLLFLCSLWATELPWLPVLALLNQTLVVFFLDQLGRRLKSKPAGAATEALQVTLALGHLAILLPVLLRATTLPLASALVLLLTLALFMGQISHPNAHELIHHPRRLMRKLGALVYGSMLLGHHVSAHLRVHHSHVATAKDPNTARRGEGFYRFLLRAWVGSFRAGLRAENAARSRKKPAPSRLWHPYVGYMLTAAATLAGSYFVAGGRGLSACLFVALYAQVQVFLADYVQHYGLWRQVDASGRPEPVAAAHSWNAPHWYSSAMMLNAPRHSDHHLTPKRPFPELELSADMPLLPHSLPVMAVIALVPALWRRVMARELQKIPPPRARSLD